MVKTSSSFVLETKKKNIGKTFVHKKLGIEKVICRGKKRTIVLACAFRRFKITIFLFQKRKRGEGRVGRVEWTMPPSGPSLDVVSTETTSSTIQYCCRVLTGALIIIKKKKAAATKPEWRNLITHTTEEQENPGISAERERERTHFNRQSHGGCNTAGRLRLASCPRE